MRTIDVPASREPRAASQGADAPRLVLLPGNTMCAEFYLPLARELAERGVASTLVTLPGYGETPPLSPPSWPALLDATRPVVETADVLVGHSLGGMLAFQHAAERGDRLRRLVLLEPAIVPWSWLAAYAGRAYLRGVEAEREVTLDGPGGYRRVGDPATFPKEAWALAAWGHRVTDRATQRALVSTAADLYPLPYARVTARTLLVRGSQTGWLMAAAQRALARRLPRAERAVLQGAGHWLANEHDAELASLIATFAGG